MVTTEQIKTLRDQTGVSVMQCKKALESADGDFEKALVLLRKKGSEVAAKKADRELGAGTIASYVHGNGAVGALVELSCETDFVAKNEEFKQLAYNIAMQVVAQNPDFLRTEDILEKDRASASEVFAKELADKPLAMREKILQGKLKSYFADKVLLEQSFIRDPELTIGGIIEQAIQKFGEKIEIRRFSRFSVS